MDNDNTELRLDQLARRRAKAKLGWFAHATVYLAVNLGLIALSLAHGRGWAVFPLLGWGVGLLLHGAAVWLFAPGGNLLERMVQRERAKLAATRGEPW
ncbi:2TM domain-containing protein [Variovorax sp. ZT4R33]|uniref:2TM domain-containing protein n=1 Tax=Variovorax sp. ZT4R33 TaxID=3443743 RepID=UPI003F46513D